MKPVYQCDYCSKMGTEEEIREHEPKCLKNYDRKNCHTCVHAEYIYKSPFGYKCKAGKEIPPGKMMEFCDIYEQKENKESLFGVDSDLMFGRMWGL